MIARSENRIRKPPYDIHIEQSYCCLIRPWPGTSIIPANRSRFYYAIMMPDGVEE